MDLLNYLTIFISIVTIVYAYSRYKLSYWARRGIYSPPCHWLFGHFKDVIFMKASPPHVLGQLHNSVDSNVPCIGIYVFYKPFLLVRSPELMKHIFIKDFNNFSNRYFAFKREKDPVGSKNLFSLDNPEWKHLRGKLSPAFTSGKQKKLFSLMTDSASNMKEYLNRLASSSKEKINIDFRKVATKYTTDVITSLSFGIKTNSFQEPEPEFYVRSRQLFDQSFINVFGLFVNFFFPKVNDFFGSTFFHQHENYFRSIFWESMNDREQSKIPRGDVIDTLVALKNEKQSSEFRFEGDTLLAQSAIFLVAGLETSAVTMSFTLLELAKNLEIQKKVRQEIREKLSDSSEVTYEMVSEMTYLQQVVAETLRIYPPAPLLDRVANEDYKIPGTNQIIEKGTVVYTTLTGIQMDPQYHPDPLVYDPDRFSEERKKDIKTCTYMPFGEGPRICIGNRLGAMQTTVGLITILKDYTVSLNPIYKNEVSKTALFLSPENGINLYFQKDG